MASRVGRPPVSRNRVLVALAEAKSATAVDLDSNVAYLDSLVRTGYIRRAGSIHTGTRGRPPVIFRLTNKGRGRARRLVKVAA